MPTLISTEIETPIGIMLAAAYTQSEDAALVYADFIDKPKMRQSIEETLEKYYQCRLQVGQTPLLQETQSQLEDYFCGKLRAFRLSLAPPGTVFQRTVWDLLKQIPYGETWTYSQQAALYGKPSALRAVAAANGKNPLSIIVPCHRVIGKNGALTGYSGGLERKAFLLDLEQRFK